MSHLCAICAVRPAEKWRRKCWECSPGHSAAMGRAHYRTKKAVAAGVLPDPKTLYCVDCGAFATCYDHRDYSKPLDVQPVCRSCNVKRGPAANSQTSTGAPPSCGFPCAPERAYAGAFNK